MAADDRADERRVPPLDRPVPDDATIFALSSGAPPAAIGVVRISGTQAGAALAALHGALPPPRRATLGWLTDPADGERLDRALLLWLPGPGTATGEDLAELHLHGGRAVTTAVLSALARLPGLRPAEAGEFTRRAFANGVIDLAQAEGLADLLQAETEAQRRSAQALAGGALSRRVAAWQARILDLSAEVEAIIDHADEEDVPDTHAAVTAAAAAIAGEMAALLAQPPAERLRDGIRVVIAGPPNAGKSTLLNALAGRDAAIVSPVAGTTRDLIEAPLTLAGRPFLVVDTAGLREGGDEVERTGIARAEAAVAACDILIWLGDPIAAPVHPRRIIVHAKADQAARECLAEGADLSCSAVTGYGLQALVDRLVFASASLLPANGEVALHRRQRDAVHECVDGLSDTRCGDLLVVAEGLRLARRALDRITGRAGTEDVLNVLFSRFCIGK